MINYLVDSKARADINDIANRMVTMGTLKIVTDIWTATANQTVFTLSGGKKYDTDKPVKVWVDGILVFAIGSESDGLVRTSTSSFTMNAGVDVDSEVVFEGFKQTDYSGVTIVAVTGDKTLALSDAGTYQNATAAANITIPPNSNVAFPVGTDMVFFRDTASEVALVAGSGVTIKSDTSYLKIGSQNTSVYLKKVATDTWHLSGSLKA